MKRLLVIISIILIAGSFTTAVYTAYRSNLKSELPIIFAEKPMLENIWHSYKQNYIEPNTYRTIDKQRSNITTSEGQSYTMLRSVWSDDKETFDKSWKWTKDILKRKEDNLFAWKFGKKPDGSYGILDFEGGYNTASDADSDIALALIFAFARWGNREYLEDARLIVKDIWKNEVVFTVNNKPILVATNLEKSLSKDQVIVNPSYLSPYAYRLFAKIDDQNKWDDLVNSSYWLLDKSLTSNLDKTKSANLFPDWVILNLKDESLNAIDHRDLTTNYSYDAIRSLWRLGVDWQWNNDTRAKELIEKFELLNNEWRNNKKIKAIYAHDGLPLADWESVASYACNLVYFSLTNKDLATEIFDTKLRILYNPDTQTWKDELTYYDDNWAWFGISLYYKLLPNLANNIQNFSIF